MSSITTTTIELRRGLWMVKAQQAGDQVGVIRGYISAIHASDGIRFLARLPALNPTQGLRIGEYWEWDRAIEAILAERPRPVDDPFKDLHYSSPAENAKRVEKARTRRRLSGRLQE